MKITQEIAEKVLATVDAGLSMGLGKPEPGEMCVEAAVCYALALPHDDNPSCVEPALRAFKIRLNDTNWSSKDARAKGMRRLALIQLGSAGHLNGREFVRRVAELAIRKAVPAALQSAASIQRNPEHKAALLKQASICEREGAHQAHACADAAAVAHAAVADAADADAAAVADAADADAAANAANAADAAAYAAYAANAANAAANAAAYAAYAAAAAANAAAAAANAANAAADAAARDKSLTDFAEEVVQLLVDMGAPGAQWLPLTEAPLRARAP